MKETLAGVLVSPSRLDLKALDVFTDITRVNRQKALSTHPSSAALFCPLCRSEVTLGSAGCRACHLEMRDVLRNQPRREERSRVIGQRLTGLVLYGAVVAWCVYQIPDVLPFVVPAAVLGGGVLHIWRGKPWLGLTVFALIVVVVPLLLVPSIATGTYLDFRND